MDPDLTPNPYGFPNRVFKKATMPPIFSVFEIPEDSKYNGCCTYLMWDPEGTPYTGQTIRGGAQTLTQQSATTDNPKTFHEAAIRRCLNGRRNHHKGV